MPNMYSYVHDLNLFTDPYGTEQISFRAAFNQAKENLNIPKNVNTPKPTTIWDPQYKNRTVWAFEGEHKGKFIVMHEEDKFGRGPYLHTATSKDGVFDPTVKRMYNQNPGHIPEDMRRYERF